MRLVVTGQHGQVARALIALGPQFGAHVIALARPEIDLADERDLLEPFRRAQPDVIVSAAAYTAVDRAESEPDIAQSINARAPERIAAAAAVLNVPLIHLSTDYVFDGSKGSTYIESDLTNPLSVYGETKLEGEQLVQAVGGAYLIFRTSWVYSMRGQEGFLRKVLQWSRQQETLRMVTDQVSGPTWARMLAEATAQIVARGQDYVAEHSGLYHLAGSGFASRFEWAKKILELDPNRQEQITKEVLPAKTADFPTPAERPLFSALDCSKFETTFDMKLPDWETALRLAMH